MIVANSYPTKTCHNHSSVAASALLRTVPRMKQPTLGTDIRTVSRLWSKLPKSIAHDICCAARPHPIALLVKDLNFEYVRYDHCPFPDSFRLQITTRGNQQFVSRQFCPRRHKLRHVAPNDFEPKPIRSYWCHRFGYLYLSNNLT